MNERKFNINITDYETPDLEFSLSPKATAELKKNVLARIEKIENNNSPDNTKIISFRRKFISFIVAATLLIGSTTAIASITNTRQKTGVGFTEETAVITNTNIEETESKSTTSQTTANTSTNTESESNIFPEIKEKKYVRLDCDIIPDYTLINRNNGWYSLEHSDGYNCNKNVDLEIIYCDSPWSRDFVQHAGLTRPINKVPRYHQFFLEERKAMYITYPYGGTYTQQLFIQQHGTGYVFTLIAGDGISKEELIEIGKKIRLESCEKQLANRHVYFSEYLENYNPDKLRPENYAEQISKENIAEMCQPIAFENWEITVESITPYDNINPFITTEQEETESETLVEEATEIPQETQAETQPQVKALGMNSVLLANLNLFVNPDGTMPYYERNTIVNGDGIMTPEEKILAQEMTRQKFCVVQFKVKNKEENSAKNLNTQFPLEYIYKGKDCMYYATYPHSRPVMEEMCQKSNQPSYYFAEDKNINLQAGEERTIQLGYFVDEDLLSQLYLSIANSNFDSYTYVDTTTN